MEQRPTTMNLHLVLPQGTQVVTRAALRTDNGTLVRRGAVGTVVGVPADAAGDYRVRLPDGVELACARDQLSIRKQVQEAVLGADDVAHEALFAHVIYRCVVGSRAFGLDGPDSDTDRRGIYLPPAALHWSLGGVPGMIERPASEEAYWELERFLELALKANPNVLECLWSPMVEHASPLALELLALREAFLSQLIYQTYNGYVMSQFKKLETDLRTTGTVKWKHAMHLIRLLLAGIAALEDGVVLIDVAAHRDELLVIRRGEQTWDAVDTCRRRLHARFDAAFATTRLPLHPDTARVNAFLIHARRTMAQQEDR